MSPLNVIISFFTQGIYRGIFGFYQGVENWNLGTADNICKEMAHFICSLFHKNEIFMRMNFFYNNMSSYDTKRINFDKMQNMVALCSVEVMKGVRKKEGGYYFLLFYPLIS